MNTRQKMYTSNAKAKQFLKEEYNCSDINLFPHTRFWKDIHIEGLAFDGICILRTKERNYICLFQIKSNEKISKKMLNNYRLLSTNLGIKCLWVNVINRKGVEVYE